MKRTLKLFVALIAAFAAIVAVATAASSPAVSTESAGSVGSSSAVLRGAIRPNGAKTGYRFEWGLTTAYGTVSRLRSAGSSDTHSVAVSLKLHHLLPGTVYHYRLLAENRLGGSTGADRKFKTKGNPPPYAATGPASQVNASGATVTAVINPNHVKTTWYFQYGPSTTYSSRTFSQTVAAGGAPVTVSAQLSGLQSGTIFHYRVVALNRGVTELGSDAMFMTYPNHAPLARVRARTTPRHARRRPYSFTTSGRVIPPSSTPDQFACSQNVQIRFFLGRRRVARTVAPLQPNCTFSAQTVFRHRPGRRHPARLRVLVQFLGNGYMARNRARTEHVNLG
jgi:phosphodiesterase/alkaline phosphatase D-like protein